MYLSFLLRTSITKKKTATYKGSDGTALWSVTVTGTFNYNGTTSSCTSSSIETKSYVSNWKLSNKKASKSGVSSMYVLVFSNALTLENGIIHTINKNIMTFNFLFIFTSPIL